MALQAAMQLPDNDLLIITLRLTFGGACPFEWGIMSETICDLAKELLKCNDWDPRTLHALIQKEIPTCEYLNDDVPFATGQELIVNVPVDPGGYADVYINDTTKPTINLPGTHNAEQLKARSHPPSNRGGRSAKQQQQAYPLGANGGIGQIKGGRGTSRDKSNPRVAFQFSDTHRDPP